MTDTPVGSKSDLCSSAAIVSLYGISWYIAPRYNGIKASVYYIFCGEVCTADLCYTFAIPMYYILLVIFIRVMMKMELWN